MLAQLPPTTEPRTLPTEHLEWAKEIARGMLRRMPASVESDDLQQEAQLACWKAYQRWRPEWNTSFRGFAFQHVRGACWELARRRHLRESTHSQLDRDAVIPIHADPGNGLDQATVLGVLWSECWPLLRPKHQRILAMRYLQDASLPEIARAVGICKHTVRVEIQRALVCLRTELRSRGTDASAVDWS